MKRKLLLPFLFVILIGCNAEEKLLRECETEETTTLEAIVSGPKINRQKALEIAENASVLFSDGEPTKNNNRKILDCTPVIGTSKAATKGNSLSPDTLFYVVNYADNTGYVFISTDERTGEIIAFIETGNFYIQDTSKSELTNFLVSLISDYQKTKLSELQEADNRYETTKGASGSTGDKTYAAYLRNPQGPICNQVLKSDCNYGTPVKAPYEAQVQGDYYYKNKGCMATREFRESNVAVRPLLTTQWKQGAPFNNNAPLIGKNRAAAGCTATATAQVMVYHSYPTNYPSNIHNGIPTYIASLRNEKFAADFVSSASQNTVATFVRTIGDLIENQWGYPETGGSQYNIPNCFAKMGYTNPSSVMEYDDTKILYSLNFSRPVLAIGWRQTNPREGGHVWVIDGYKEFKSGYDNYYFDEYGHFNGSKFGAYRTNRDTEAHLHCNFGWGSKDDGYYYNKIFKSFIYDLEIIPNIYK